MAAKTVLITGASSGIGYAFAEIFAKNKYSLILVARREKELQELKKKCEQHTKEIRVIMKDLAQPNAAEEIYKEIKKENVRVDILINNAGFGDYGSFYKTAWKKEAAMIQVNIVALTQLAKLFGQDMLQQKQGGIIMNISSVAAFLPGPLMSVYYATKAYVLSLSEAMMHDVEGTNVKVIALCPGMTKTGFQQVAGFQEKQENEEQMVSAEEVAAYGFEVIQEGKSKIAIPGWKNKVIARVGWLLPRSFVAKIILHVQGARKKE